uniref:CCHC-type domain-containing protein n=1 Tax=Fagus sylvatica TaxID=28930 RepID=A0A2N9G0R0_FAGSY
MTDDEWDELDVKAVSSIRLLLADEVMYDVMEENTTAGIWLNLEKRYMSKSLISKLHLKQKLFGLRMSEGADLRQHINIFKQIISDLLQIDVKFEDEDKAMMLLTSLPASYEHLKNSAKSSGDGLVVKGYQDRRRKKDKNDKSVRGRSKSKSKTVKCYKCQKNRHFKRDCPKWKKKKEESSKFVNVVAVDSESDGDMLSVSSSTNDLNNSWLLDSACSFHVTPHRSWFDTYSTILGGVAAISESEDDDTLLWHMRLGHMSERDMRELHKRNLLVGIRSYKLDFCKYCVVGKQCRNKSDTFATFKKWKAEVENQTERKLKCLKTDNGTEYRDGEFLKFCE